MKLYCKKIEVMLEDDVVRFSFARLMESRLISHTPSYNSGVALRFISS